MSNVKTCFIGWHVLQEACITGEYVVVVVISFIRMCYGKTCLIGGYVLWADM